MLLPLLASILIVVGSPYVGQIRSAVQSTFPDQYRWIVGGIVVVAAAGAMASAVARLRRWQHDSSRTGRTTSPPLWLRYALIALAAGISAAYAGAMRTGNPDVDLVEAFHFVEYGLVAYWFYGAWRSRPDVSAVVFAACASLAVGLADEWVQWLVPGRVGEMHDVWLNATAIGCGLLVSMAVHPPSSLASPASTDSRLAMGAAVGALIVAAAAFVDRVHIGYEVYDPGTGAFRSTYDARALDAAADDRVARWATSPPATRGFRREDHYLSEGEWHVQRRNLALTDRDWRTAWSENVILERFYGPVLERGYRWPEGQRAVIEANAGPVVQSAYVSDAEPYPIYVVPRALFWSATVALGAAIPWLVARRRRTPEPARV